MQFLRKTAFISFRCIVELYKYFSAIVMPQFFHRIDLPWHCGRAHLLLGSWIRRQLYSRNRRYAKKGSINILRAAELIH